MSTQEEREELAAIIKFTQARYNYDIKKLIAAHDKAVLVEFHDSLPYDNKGYRIFDLDDIEDFVAERGDVPEQGATC